MKRLIAACALLLAAVTAHAQVDRATLSGAVKDAYKRAGSKKARNWPHKKKDKPPGEPKLREATDVEVALAKEIRDKKAAA